MNREQSPFMLANETRERSPRNSNDVDTLKYIMKEHMLSSAPSLTCLRQAKKRKKVKAHSRLNL